MLLEDVTRLQDRRVRQRVDLDDAAIGAVVEAAVDAERAVDPVHHAHTPARETPQPAEVEVERVVETRRGPARERVQLDVQPATAELTDEREQELVAAAVRRRVELVEDRDVARRAA